MQKGREQVYIDTQLLAQEFLAGRGNDRLALGTAADGVQLFLDLLSPTGHDGAAIPGPELGVLHYVMFERFDFRIRDIGSNQSDDTTANLFFYRHY